MTTDTALKGAVSLCVLMWGGAGIERQTALPHSCAADLPVLAR